MTISEWSIKYWFIFSPLASVFRCTQSGSSLERASRFCKKRMSLVTSVPAASLKVLLGRRMAPSRSARWARYFRTVGVSLSIVPLLVTKAMTPPGLTLSSVRAKK